MTDPRSHWGLADPSSIRCEYIYTSYTCFCK